MSLEDRVGRLEAIEAARQLLARYARACDGQDLEGVVQLFAKEAQIQVPGHRWRGVNEIREFFRSAWSEDPSRKRHFVTNVDCDGYDDGRVSMTAYFMYTAAGPNLSVLGWGEYRDEVDTTGAEPVFTRKWMTVAKAADVREGWAQ